MYQYIDRFFQGASRCLDHMTPTQWFVALVVVLVVGGFCLRGFGSRSNY